MLDVTLKNIITKSAKGPTTLWNLMLHGTIYEGKKTKKQKKQKNKTKKRKKKWPLFYTFYKKESWYHSYPP